jgi:hypothetical protein
MRGASEFNTAHIKGIKMYWGTIYDHLNLIPKDKQLVIQVEPICNCIFYFSKRRIYKNIKLFCWNEQNGLKTILQYHTKIVKQKKTQIYLDG